MDRERRFPKRDRHFTVMVTRSEHQFLHRLAARLDKPGGAILRDAGLRALGYEDSSERQLELAKAS